MGLPANYIIVEDIENRPLIIKDIGPWDKYFSVTNDAENVVMKLYKEHKLENNRRLFYYDSNNELSELLYDSYGSFEGFTCL